MTIIKPLGEQSLSGFYFITFNSFLLRESGEALVIPEAHLIHIRNIGDGIHYSLKLIV